MRCVGVSICSFIRSSRLVPPAMNFAPGDARGGRSGLGGRVRAFVGEGLHALPPGDFGDRIDDVGVGAAAADVAAHPLAHLGCGQLGRRGQVGADVARNARLDLVEHRDRRADLPRRAVAALVAVMLDERRLHRVQVVGRAQALDGGDLVALVHDREREAGGDPPAIHDHGAGAALALIAALLAAGQMQVLAQCVEQGGARIELELPACPVYVEGHVHGLRRRWRIASLRLGGDGRQAREARPTPPQ